MGLTLICLVSSFACYRKLGREPYISMFHSSGRVWQCSFRCTWGWQCSHYHCCRRRRHVPILCCCRCFVHFPYPILLFLFFLLFGVDWIDVGLLFTCIIAQLSLVFMLSSLCAYGGIVSSSFLFWALQKLLSRATNWGIRYHADLYRSSFFRRHLTGS